MTPRQWDRAVLAGLGLLVLVAGIGVALYVIEVSRPLPATLEISRATSGGVELDDVAVRRDLPFLALAFEQAADHGSASLSGVQARQAIAYLRDAIGDEALGTVDYDGVAFTVKVHRDIR